MKFTITTTKGTRTIDVREGESIREAIDRVNGKQIKQPPVEKTTTKQAQIHGSSYNSVVENTYALAKAQGIKTTRLKVLSFLIEYGILDFSGIPTQHAINQGLVKKLERGDKDGLNAISKDPTHDLS